MWGRELRAGLAFVLVSLLAGAGVRAWRRDHEVRFQELVEALVERDLSHAGRPVARGAGGDAGRAGGPSGATPGGASGDTGSPAPSRRSGSARAEALRPGSLDVDRATVEEWIRLPGIGPALAARIVADRNARGPFAVPEKLLRVPGIGPRILERIRPFLTRGRGGPATPDSILPDDSHSKPLR
jgi:competence ComEA-like helix-hairpin-helix protein